MSENDPTDFGAYLERQIAHDPELSALVAEAEKELEAEETLEIRTWTKNKNETRRTAGIEGTSGGGKC